MNGGREYGDFQTPPEFSEKVCQYLRNVRNIRPTAVVEPTCGTGSFLQSSLVFDAGEYYGIEINPEYCEICRNTIHDTRVNIINADFFTFSTKSLIRNPSKVLVIGNPPWVTNSALSASESDNLPKKRNFRNLRGIEAMTGASNFDICEYIILKLIQEYSGFDAIIAMLCKTAVARNVFLEMKRTGVGTVFFDVLEFDAARVFGVSASACVLLTQLSRDHTTADECRVYDWKNPSTLKKRFGFSGGRFYSALDLSAAPLDGVCPFVWRQGVKHDCSRVMELTPQNGGWRNGYGETVEIEPEYVFPLVKSSMFKEPVLHSFQKYVLVTQRKAGEDTEHIARDAPRTWAYLNQHREDFLKRKSAVYRNAHPFSMFGIGAYSFSRYKVGISGFYKEPLFSLLYAEDGKSVMTDDTAYFIPFDRYDMAYTVMLLFNSQKVRGFLKSIVFLDAKRPYTKKALSRIDIKRASETVPLHALVETERNLRLPRFIDDSIYGAFREWMKEGQLTIL